MEEFNHKGMRNAAAAIVKAAYSDYWTAFKRNNTYEMERLENFFQSDWYKDVLCTLAPSLTRCKFEEFKASLPFRLEEKKQGRPAFSKFFGEDDF